MSQPPPSIRVFIAGTSGAGKSTAAWTHYLSRFPRRLLLDYTGEWEHTKPDAEAYDVAGVARAMRAVQSRGRWTIVAAMSPAELPELVAYLIPVPQIDHSPVRMVGGVVLLVDEVDLVAPPRGLSEEIRTLWRRSRHAGLSIVATTQRPEAVSREVTAQCWQVLCLHLGEPAALAYMAATMGGLDLTPLQEWTRTHPHGGLWRDQRAGRCLWLTEQGQWVRPAVESARVSPSPVASDALAEPAPVPDGEPES